LAVRLAVIGGKLRQEFVVGDPGRGIETGFGLDLLADPQRDVPGQWNALQVLGDVEIGLIERKRLDDRRVLGENVADLPADLLVDLEAWPYEDQVRALAFRRYRRHRRADSELSGLVACRCNDAALRRTADRNRLAAKLRIISLFDRRVERVHVDVDDLAMR